jgi:hypothetical protein
MQVHSEYTSGQAARHWTISTPIQHESELSTTSTIQTLAGSPASDVTHPTALDWSQANNNTSAHIEAEVELAEMKDCELKALGLKQFLTAGTKSQTLSQKTNQTFTQSVSGFISGTSFQF